MNIIFPNDTEDEKITQLQQYHTLDLEDFFHTPFLQLMRQCQPLQNTSLRNLLHLMNQQQQQGLTPREIYYRKMYNLRKSFFPMLSLGKLDQIEGKKYKIVLYSEIMYRLTPQKMICCICEKEILLALVEKHTLLCSKRTTLKQSLVQICDELQRLQEESSMKEIELITKMNMYNKKRLSSKNLSHQNSPIMNRQQQQQQVSLSKFAQQPTRSIQRAKTINLSDTVPQRSQKRQMTRQFDSLSPDSTKQIRNAISLLKVMQQYITGIILNDCMDIDIKYQALLKLGILEVAHLDEVQQLLKWCLCIMKQRIDLHKQLNKLEAQLNQLQNKERLKRQFQKGISSSFKIGNRSRSNSNSKIRVMEMLQKPKLSRFQRYKEDAETPTTEQELRKNSSQHSDDNKQCSLQVFSQEDDDDENNRIGYFSDNQISAHQRSNSKIMSIGLKDFEFVEVLGVGAYGAVWKVRKLKTNDIYAMKVIDTTQTANKNIQKTLKAEKDIFQVIQGDYVAKAYYSFSHADCLFYLLEYVRGGDFDKILRKYGALEQHIAAFYLAELLLAIEALHKKHIIHRDLKPENILLDHHGHLKLTDFGLSEFGMKKLMGNSDHPSKALELQEKIERKIKKIQKDQTNAGDSSQHKHRIIGTPDYIAPEIIQGESYINESIDMWSLGVLAYEFLIGIPPFNDDSPDKIFKNILKRNIEWPVIGYEENQISPVAKDFIDKLLNYDYTQRMTVEEAKAHQFFQNIDFEKIRKTNPPIRPDPEPDDQPLMIIKKEREKEKMNKLLKDTSSDTSNISRFGVDNLLRLDLLVDLNQQKANQLRKKKYL